MPVVVLEYNSFVFVMCGASCSTGVYVASVLCGIPVGVLRHKLNVTTDMLFCIPCVLCTLPICYVVMLLCTLPMCYIGMLLLSMPMC